MPSQSLANRRVDIVPEFDEVLDEPRSCSVESYGATSGAIENRPMNLGKPGNTTPV